MKIICQSICLISFLLSIFSCNPTQPSIEKDRNDVPFVIKKKGKEQRIGAALKENEEKIKDPALGRSTPEELVKVYALIDKKVAERKTSKNPIGIEELKWTERGPYSIGGRTRAIIVDLNDPTRNTVWAAGVTGGLWKTETIKSNPPNWVPVGDNIENIAICAIAQDENNPDIMYFGTGEPHAGAVSGIGIWKSVNGGDSWDYLPSTSGFQFRFVVRLLIHPDNGDVYAVTNNGGVRRSQDGGATWVEVLGTVTVGGKSDMTDIEIAADGTLFASGGHSSGNAKIWKSPAGSTVGDPGTWDLVMNGLPGDMRRIEMAAAPSNEGVLYCVGTKGGTAFSFYVTNNQGTNWSARPLPQSGYSTGQAWYDLCIAVDPNNHNRVISGNFNQFISTDGASSWTNISSGVHVDQHYILYEHGNSDVVYLGNDGGVYRSDNAGGNPNNIKFYNRNARYNVTQFYACHLHPDSYSNFFLAGSQDNGTQRFNKPGLGRTTYAFGADGAYCHIDQNEPQYQLVSWQNGNYLLSDNGGLTFSAGGVSINEGFINDSDYDDDANILYAYGGLGQLYRWDITQQDGAFVNINGTNQRFRHISCSPNVANRIYIGSTQGSIYRIDDAHQGVLNGTPIHQGLQATGNISSITIAEGNEDHIIVTFSNYGVPSVHETHDGGQTWENHQGDLPNMPVRWALLNPLDTLQVFLATEAGIWVTNKMDGSNTVWEPSFKAPFVRTDMLQYRKSDNLIIAGTYGRGLWSCDGFSPPLATIEPDQVTYIGANKLYQDFSVNPSTWTWDLGDGTTASSQDVYHAYNQIGTYTVSLTIDNGLVDSEQVKVLPDRATPYAIGEAGFAGDFESHPEDFGVHNIGGTPFQKGRSTKQGKSGTNSGNNAWVIGLNDDFYEPNTHSVLYTPNYDLSDQGIYELSFFAKYDIQQGFDGFLVEYSLDKGISWSPLGKKSAGWYNYSNIDASSPTSFPTGSEYFTGKTTGSEFKEYKYNLKEFEAEDEIAFRFVFRTDNETKYPGLALDDIQLKALKTDLATKLISFTGSYLSYETVELNWVTLPEYRCKGFEIEVSENGVDFNQVGVPTFVNASGYTIEETGYLVEPDQEFKREEHFFRIKVIDFDDDHFYSDILPLRREADAPKAVYLTFPNPVTDHVNITFNDLISEENVSIELFDALGRKVLSAENPEINDVSVRLELPVLADGVYFLKVLIGDERYVTKLQKN